MAGMSSLVRIVNAGVPGSQDRVDVVLRDGVVASVNPAGTDLASHGTMPAGAHMAFSAHTSNAADTGSAPTPTPAAAPADETTINADGLWIIPGLWDCHTHFTQWAKTLGRLDLINTRSAAEAMDMLHRHLDERRAAGTLDPDAFVVGMRFRHSLWADGEQPTLAAIDAVTGDQPVAWSASAIMRWPKTSTRGLIVSRLVSMACVWTPVYIPNGYKSPSMQGGIPARNCRAVPGLAM